MPVIGRLLRVSIFDRSVQSRLWVWQTAYEGWKERPLLGWGPENFTKVFNNRFDIRHFVPDEPSDTWYDRAHSVFFDYLVETGIFGLLSYLGIFAVFYWQFIKSQITNYQSLITNALLFTFPVAYLIQGIVLFEILPLYLLLFFFLALSNYKLQETKND